VQKLTEPGDQVQAGVDRLPHRLDPEATVRVEQLPAVEDGQSADVLRPANLVRPHHAQILSVQAFHAATSPGT
jgi:hypothetical protein